MHHSKREFLDRPTGRVFLLVALVAVIATVYHEAWRIPYFADDFQWVTTNPSSTIFGCFVRTIGPDNHWYRPTQAMVLSAIQTLWGFDTFPIHVVEILVHAASALLIFHILRTLKMGALGSLFGACFFALAQIAAACLGGNDYLSQTLSGLLSLSTLWLIYRGGWDWRHSRYYFALLTFSLALFSKEASAGLFVGILLMMLITAPSGQRWSPKVWTAAIRTIPFAALLAAYLLIRMAIGASAPSFQSGTYGFSFGLNVLKNAALFAFQGALPTSSLSVARFVYYRSFLPLAMTVIFMAAFAGTLLYGAVRAFGIRRVGVLALLAWMSLVPVIFLNHVSEVYLYNALPYIAIVSGISFGWYLSESPKHPLLKYAGLGILSLSIVTNIMGAREKTQCLKADGFRGNTLLTQFYPIVKNSQPNAYLYFIHPQIGGFGYSTFTQPGFRVCLWADGWVARHTARYDVSIRILEDSEYRDSITVHPGAAWTYDTTTLKLKPLYSAPIHELHTHS